MKGGNVVSKYPNNVWESRRAAWHFMFETIRFGTGGEDQVAGRGPTNC